MTGKYVRRFLASPHLQERFAEDRRKIKSTEEANEEMFTCVLNAQIEIARQRTGIITGLDSDRRHTSLAR